MTKVKLIKANNGDRFLISTDLTAKALQIANALKPEVLVLSEKTDSGHKEVFKVGLGKDASASSYGVTFPAGDDANATLRITVPAPTNVLPEVINATAVAIRKNLEKVENQVTEFLATVTNETIEVEA